MSVEARPTAPTDFPAFKTINGCRAFYTAANPANALMRPVANCVVCEGWFAETQRQGATFPATHICDSCHLRIVHTGAASVCPPSTGTDTP